MKVVHLNLVGDPVGVSWLLHCELLKSGIESYHILGSRKQIHKQQGGYQFFADENTSYIIQLINETDIIHINIDLEWTYPQFDYSILKGKKIILHNHGGYNLLYPENQINKFEKMFGKIIYAGCSPLTKKLVQDAVWLPNIIPIYESLYMPVEKNYSSKILICHKVFAESSFLYKGTEVLNEMLNVLKDKWNFNLSFDIYFNKTISEVLKETSYCHICIDNITQGFIGLAGFESLSKGQIVIARLDPSVEEAYNSLGDECPIINVSGFDELCKVIREICLNKEAVKRRCIKSREWMENYYSPNKIIKIYINLYKEIILC